MSDTVQHHFSGARLIGDDFTPEQEAQWYEEEEQAYRELGHDDEHNYPYDALNNIVGYSGLPKHLPCVLGIGSAHGREFAPIADRIDDLTIVEPDTSWDEDGYEVDGTLSTTYVVPGMGWHADDPWLPVPDNSMDLVTCFGVLHHVARVTRAMEEIHRVLRPGGIALIREPITSMGDWRKPRPGLTKNERGIPLNLMLSIVSDAGFTEGSYSLCGFAPLRKLVHKLTGRNMWSSSILTRIDLLTSKVVTAINPEVVYHPQTFFERCAPTSIFLRVQKSVQPRTQP